MKKLFLTLMMALACIWAWADNSVTVTYNGNTATVTVDDNVAQYLTVTQSGAHVSIAQSSSVAQEITYTLTGTSTNGEFYMSGSYKATIELNGLTLTNSNPVYSGAAVHIQNGKRINVKVITGTTNTLTDAASGSQKGCLYVKGHAEFKQQGTLNVVGNKSHAIKAGEYISVKNATINVTSAVDDGISCNQYFLMESGTINISGTGDDGIQCDLDGETSTGMTVNHEDEDSGNFYVSGGTITINSDAIAAKGIKCQGDAYISGTAVINVTTTGKGEWDATDQETNAACGLSADGDINISGGTLTLTATGSGGKGMKCDNVLNISGGNITVSTSGGLYYNDGNGNENTNYTSNTDWVDNNYYSAAKGIKAGYKDETSSTTICYGGINISGGTTHVTTTGRNAEGIESKNYLNVTGGETTIDAYDDGINAAQDLYIGGGYLYSRSNNNDGIDANGNVIIEDGLIYAIGAAAPEVAIDANSEENKKFHFNGGILIAIGGLESGSSLAQTCYQASSVSSNTWYSMTYGGNVIAFFTPSISSGGGGGGFGPGGGGPGGGSSSGLVISAPSTPTLKSGVTVSSGTPVFYGPKCYLDATVTGGSNVSLTQYSSGGGGTSGSYTVTATANPTGSGTVTGAGTYTAHTLCTLTATANNGYTFVNWTRNGSVASTDPTYKFYVTENTACVANFEQSQPYIITATANPTEAGTVTGTGTYNQGSIATLTAIANSGYAFTNWTMNGTQVSTNNPYSFTVTSDSTFVANFTALQQHTVTCNTTQNGTISASPTSAYMGDIITLTATPASGYYLGSWTVMDASNNNITVTNNQFTMPDSNVTVSATFVVGYSVTLAPATNGTISANPTGGSAGTTVTLTATPATGYVFDSWVVFKTGDATTSVTVTNNSFTLPSYNVTVVGIFTAPQGGEVTIGSGTTSGYYLPTGDYYKYSLTQQIYTASELGTAGTITAISFYYNTSTSSNPRSLQVYMSHTSSSTITAWSTVTSNQLVYSGSYTFNQGWNTITLTTPFAYNGTSNVLLTVDDNTGSWTTNSQFYTYSTGANRAIYYRNDNTNPDPTGNVSVTASSLQVNAQMKITKEVPSTDGYLFVSPTSLTGFEATSGATASNPQSVAVIGRNLQANLIVTAPTGYEVSSAIGGTYNGTLTLTPSNGSIQSNVFVHLSSGVSPGNYSGNITLTSGTTSASVSLNGTVIPGSGAQYTITATANPTAGGIVTGAGTYYENGTCTLVATANTGYTFTNWTKNGTQVSTNATYSFTVTENASYVANFTLNSYEVTATAEPSTGGTITGEGTYDHGATATLTATASEGYTFTNWMKNGTTVSTNATYSFTVTEATTLVANFTINSYTVTATANPAEGGSVTVGTRNRDELVYDFEDGVQGWTVLKGDTGNSPNNWHHNTTHVSYSNGGAHDWSSFGHNSSSGFMMSESYISATSPNGTAYGAVTPDNYLVSPQVRLGGSISFYAGARNTSYCAEKFSVVVSTTDNTNTASFTTVATWILSLSQAGYTSEPYTVDLSAYSGMGYIAIRHWGCSDQWVLCIDDITIVEGENQSTGTGNYNYGESCTVTATPNPEYYFAGWTENGALVSTSASYSFTVTSDRDLVANFTDEMPSQTIELVEGWNWVSTYIDMNGVNGLEMLEDALGDYGVTIATFNDQAEYIGDGLWLGLEDYQLTNNEMIMIEVNADCTVTLQGLVINPESIEITINPGWNWIGFPMASEMTIEDALGDFEPEFGDGIANFGGLTEYLGEWDGDFATLVPDQGYMYYSERDYTTTFVFQTGGSKARVKAVSPNKTKKPRLGLDDKQ